VFRIIIDNTVKTFRAVPGVVVPEYSQKLDILAFLVHLFYKILPQLHTAGIVIRQYLCDGYIVRVDFSIDAKRGNACLLCLLDVCDGPVCVCRIEQNRCVPAGDNVLEVIRLFCGVILRIKDRRFVAQLLGTCLGSICKDYEPGIVQRGNYDCNFLLRLGFLSTGRFLFLPLTA